MSTHASGTFEISSWDEKPYDEVEGAPKLTRARVTETFHGDIEGEGVVEYLMTYPTPASAHYIGLIRVTGRLGGRSGSFVLQRAGDFEGVTARATWSVVPGSGTGELAGLRGEGAFVAHHGEWPIEWAGRTWQPTTRHIAAFTLDYDFE